MDSQSEQNNLFIYLFIEGLQPSYEQKKHDFTHEQKKDYFTRKHFSTPTGRPNNKLAQQIFQSATASSGPVLMARLHLYTCGP